MSTVRDFMNSPEGTILADESVQSAIQLMLEKRVDWLAVVDMNQRLVGILSTEELLPAVYDTEMRRSPVCLFMDRSISTLSPDLPLGEAINDFVLHRSRILAVVESGMLVGWLGIQDALSAFFGRKNTENVESDEIFV